MRHGLGMSMHPEAVSHIRSPASPRPSSASAATTTSRGAAGSILTICPAAAGSSTRAGASTASSSTAPSTASSRRAVFERWVDGDAGDDFVFAVKGGRFITHNLKLRNAETSLGNFFASGVLALGRQTGPSSGSSRPPTGSTPSAWTLHAPAAAEPREAEAVALRARRPAASAARSSSRGERAAIATRSRSGIRRTSTRSSSRSCASTDCALRRRRHGGQVPVRRGGDGGLRLRAAARRRASSTRAATRTRSSTHGPAKIAAWRDVRGRDVYVYFDNDAKVHAPFDAMRLAERVGVVVAGAADFDVAHPNADLTAQERCWVRVRL